MARHLCCATHTKSFAFFCSTTRARSTFYALSRVISASISSDVSNDNTFVDAASSSSLVPRVVLKKGKARIFREGHPMVYSGAVDKVIGRPPPQTGDAVIVTDGAEKPIGWGMFNSVSMFRVRLMQMEDETNRDGSSVFNMERLIESRILAATELRCELLRLPSFDTDVYRLVNSEGDRLSGLVVDIFGGHVVVASSAAWVEKYRPNIEHAIQQATGISSIIWRPSLEILKEEGFQMEVPKNTGQMECVQVVENGVKLKVSFEGQKTGFYADQRENRLLLRSISQDKSVLDLCCYTGGFALNAAVGGAVSITGIDSSSPALELAQRNIELNNLNPDKIKFQKADITEFMKAAIANGTTWDVVVLDPPKLAPTKKVLQRASSKYRSFNALAMHLIKPGGVLMTCSCSGAITQSGNFLSILQEAAALSNRRITQLRYAGAGVDHPLDPAYPEGSYLTNVLLRVM